MSLYLIIAVFIVIFYQDLKHRAVHWAVFPVLFGLSIWSSYPLSWDVILNASFVLFTLVLLTVYLSIKHQKFVSITKGFFSWGDILFLLAIVPLFSFHLYIYFFTFGTILSLVYHLIAMMVKRQKTIPYAGYMSLTAIPYLVLANKTNYFEAIV